MKNWVVQYVYATDNNEQGMSILHLEAETYEEAKQMAFEQAAAKEFIFTVTEQSDDQFLGSVKHQAQMLVGKGATIDTSIEIDD